METLKTGYQVQSYDVPVKRYCQTLDLRDSPELIAEYRKRHSQAEAWPEILAGIREVGILEMEIYILGTRLFMIVETPLDFDWDTAMGNILTQAMAKGEISSLREIREVVSHSVTPQVYYPKK